MLYVILRVKHVAVLLVREISRCVDDTILAIASWPKLVKAWLRYYDKQSDHPFLVFVSDLYRAVECKRRTDSWVV